MQTGEMGVSSSQERGNRLSDSQLG